MNLRYGIISLLVIFLGFLGYDIGRHVLVKQDVPAFFMESRPEIQISLTGNWEGKGIFQISDGLTIIDVIKMTGYKLDPYLHGELVSIYPPETGEEFLLTVDDGLIVGFSRSWMRAAQRVALGIPLHPDRMTEEDWDYLPGVGPRVAAEITLNRQRNGDYLTLGAVSRVKGVGDQRIAAWQEFF